MKLKQVLALAILFVLGYYVSSTGQIDDITGYVISNPRAIDTESITIANWNIQTFGPTKWERPETRAIIVDVVEDYDIIFIQEIRDSSGVVFKELCAQVITHDCSISARAGRSTSKEQYGVLYRKGITIEDTIDYATRPKQYDNFERPPYVVTFNADEYIFTAVNVHLKPDDVPSELVALEVIANTHEGNVIVLGDLNADGSYYDEDQDHIFSNYNWIISNAEDTTVAASDNTYDRILLNDEMSPEYLSHGIFKNIDKSVSDHYLVWIEVATAEN